jgi:hypothetical protein
MLGVVTELLREVPFAVVYPIIDRVRRQRSREVPITGSVSRNHQLGSAILAQRKSRRVGINARSATIADSQTHASVIGDVNAIESGFLRGHRRPWCVDFEVFMRSIKFNQANDDRSLQNTQRDAFVTQSHDAQRGLGCEAHEVSRIDLNLHPAVFSSGDSIALDKWIIETRVFPIRIALALQVHFPGGQADAHDPIFHVVIVGVVVIIEGAG